MKAFTPILLALLVAGASASAEELDWSLTSSSAPKTDKADCGCTKNCQCGCNQSGECCCDTRLAVARKKAEIAAAQARSADNDRIAGSRVGSASVSVEVTRIEGYLGTLPSGVSRYQGGTISSCGSGGCGSVQYLQPASFRSVPMMAVPMMSAPRMAVPMAAPRMMAAPAPARPMAFSAPPRAAGGGC
jgi:hypothetical protein